MACVDMDAMERIEIAEGQNQRARADCSTPLPRHNKPAPAAAVVSQPMPPAALSLCSPCATPGSGKRVGRITTMPAVDRLAGLEA